MRFKWWRRAIVDRKQLKGHLQETTKHFAQILIKWTQKNTGICKIFKKKFHVSEKVSHVRSSNCTHITITMQSKQSTEEKKNIRHLTLVYMRHVTFTLIVESENINSIRALCFGACFQHTQKNPSFVSKCFILRKFIPIRCNMKITNFKSIHRNQVK